MMEGSGENDRDDRELYHSGRGARKAGREVQAGGRRPEVSASRQLSEEERERASGQTGRQEIRTSG